MNGGLGAEVCRSTPLSLRDTSPTGGDLPNAVAGALAGGSFCPPDFSPLPPFGGKGGRGDRGRLSHKKRNFLYKLNPHFLGKMGVFIQSEVPPSGGTQFFYDRPTAAYKSVQPTSTGALNIDAFFTSKTNSLSTFSETLASVLYNSPVNRTLRIPSDCSTV